MMKSLIIFAALLYGLFKVCNGSEGAARLFEDLISSYNKMVRPVSNVSESLLVRLSLRLSQLIDVVNKFLKFFTKNDFNKNYNKNKN